MEGCVLTGSSQKAYGSYLAYIVEWRAAANPAANTSDVTVNVYLSHYAVSISAKPISCTVNGVTKQASSQPLSQSAKVKRKSLLASFSFPGTAHAADGTLSCAVSSAWSCALTYSGAYYASMAVSGTLTGDKIPRASSIASLSTNVPLDGASPLAVHIDRAVPSYTHTVRFVFGTKSYTVQNAAQEASFVPPQDWLAEIPAASAGIGTCTVETYNGAAYVGSASKGFILLCPEDAVPVMADPVVTRVQNAVPAAWDLYLQNLSGVKIEAAGASGVFGSAVKSYKIECAGYTSDTSSLTVEKLPLAGDAAYTVTVTDTRGKSAVKSGSIQVAPYAPPAVDSLAAYRCDQAGNRLENGTYLCIKAGASYTVIGENLLSLSAQILLNGGVLYTRTLLAGQAAVIGPVQADKAYDVKVTAADLFSSGERWAMVSSTRYYLHFKKGGGRGVAFGKAAEHDGAVELAPELDLMLKGEALSDFVTETGESGGWTYRKWHSGMAECWGMFTEDVAWTTPIGGLYYSGFITKTLPFAMQDLVVVGEMDATSFFCNADQVDSTTIHFRSVRAVSVSAACHIHILVRGMAAEGTA